MEGASLGTTPGAHLLHFFAAAQQNMGAISYAPERRPVMLLAIASGALALHVGTNRQAQWLFAILCFVATTQFLFAPFGWFWRYELYCIALVLSLVLAGWLMRSHEVDAPLLFAISLPELIYLQPLTATPNAARSIYREQGAIAQLTHNNYDGRIAVIDLGLQAFRRPPDRYTFDLAALGIAGCLSVFSVWKLSVFNPWVSKQAWDRPYDCATGKYRRYTRRLERSGTTVRRDGAVRPLICRRTALLNG